MNILSIGNSFSEDATRYLHEIARADGEILNTANLYIGGCSLETHYKNMISGDRAYELQYNGQNTGFFVSLDDALQNRSWDVVTIQQVSHLSFNTETYYPYVDFLADHIREKLPDAKLFLHQTWAYEEGSDRLLNIARYPDPENMLCDIIKANDEVAQHIRADGIIRSGELFGLLRRNGFEGLHRDTFHASLGVGRYALALLWYSTVSKRKTHENLLCYFDDIVEQKDVERIVNIVNSVKVKHT